MNACVDITYDPSIWLLSWTRIAKCGLLKPAYFAGLFKKHSPSSAVSASASNSEEN